MIFPQSGEYATYYEKYLIRAKEAGDWKTALAAQIEDVVAVFGNLTPEQAEFRYAPEKWTLREVLAHINDTERVFAYRTLRIARGDTTPLPGFDQDVFAEAFQSVSVSLDYLIEEFIAIRKSTMLLVHTFDEAVSVRMGTASGYPVSVRALVYIMIGHVAHHLEIIRTHYLPALS